jgi:hypothetical protein
LMEGSQHGMVMSHVQYFVMAEQTPSTLEGYIQKEATRKGGQ